MATPAYLEPVEERYTKWHNPLPHHQHVDIYLGDESRPTRYRWAPGETKALPSRYDYAIHRTHNGIVIGGLAPQLVKLGDSETLDPALDTTLMEKRQAEVDAAAAAATKKAAEDSLVLAQARSEKADAERAAASKVKKSHDT